MFLLVRASHFCVAPAGQGRLRSGGLREGSPTLEHRLGCADCCRTSGCKRQLRRSGCLEWMRRFANVSCLCLRVCEHVWQVSSWVRAALEEDNYGDKGQSITEILKQNDVRGTALLKLTSGDMREMKIAMGPSKVLAERIAAVSARPTAASGFQAGASADWKGALVSLWWKFVRTTQAPRSSVLGQQTSANVSSVSYLCCCLQVEAVPKAIALIVEAAVTRALIPACRSRRPICGMCP